MSVVARRRFRMLASALVAHLGATHTATRGIDARAAGNVNVTVYDSPVFAGNYTFQTFSNVNILGLAYTAGQTAVISAFIVPPVSDNFTFSLVADGIARLWVDDFMLYDTCPGVPGSSYCNTTMGIEQRDALYPLPLTAGIPVQLLIQYEHHSDTTPSQLTLMWNSSNLGLQVVPASSFAQLPLPAAEVKRRELQRKLYQPEVGWTTFWSYSMTRHVLMPQSIGIDVAFLDMYDGDVLGGGGIIYWPYFSPAWVRPGLHSFNGSDYTDLWIGNWGNRSCDMRIQTTVGGPQGRDLMFLISANGTDCSRLAMLAQPGTQWFRPGDAHVSINGSSMTASVRGFDPVNAFISQGAMVNATCSNSSTATLCVPFGAFCSAADPCVVGYSSGQRYPVAAMASAIADARERQMAMSIPWGGYADVYQAITTVLAWNVIYVPSEYVITTISKQWGTSSGFVLAGWDTCFGAYLHSIEGGLSLELALQNLIQIVRGRTVPGFIPNILQGTGKTYDRSETQVATYILRDIYLKWGEEKVGWVVDLLFDTLLDYNTWRWTARRGEGVFATAPDGKADLIVLGSDPVNVVIDNDGSINTQQGARYESLDNAPMYDGLDNKLGPVMFNNVTHHMELYEVGATGMLVADAQALIQLATMRNMSQAKWVVPMLQERVSRLTNALNTLLWDNGTGIWQNTLYNGTAYPRVSPFNFHPLIGRVASDEQALATLQILQSPSGMCVNANWQGIYGNATAMLVNMYSDAGHTMCGVRGNDCIAENLVAGFQTVAPWVEAIVLANADGVRTVGGVRADATILPLNLLFSSELSRYYVATNTTGPTTTFDFVELLGYCFGSGSDAPGLVPLTMWYDPVRMDWQACATQLCINGSIDANYTALGTICFVRSPANAADLPCTFSGPSIARSDEAFYDQDYWRGRIWAPQLQLMYWGLQQYAHLPQVAAAKKTFAAQAENLLLQNWLRFSQVNENCNAMYGLCEDGAYADPFYHWGGLAGLIALQEAGLY